MVNGYRLVRKRIGHIPIPQIVLAAFVIKECAVLRAERFVKGGKIEKPVRSIARAKKRGEKTK